MSSHPHGSIPPKSTSQQAPPSGAQPAASADHIDALSEVQRALAELRHGTVTLVVQDGRVVQVETTSKVRFAGAQRQTTRWNP
jgi:hypothetical protein